MSDLNSAEIPADIQARREQLLLSVRWGDETRDYPFALLRGACQCAHCVDEWTGQQLLDTSTIPPDITIDNMELVGNYALRIHWSDGHRSGLTTWRQLRELSRG